MAKHTCSIDGCSKATNARGLCSTHYARWRRSGGTGRGCDVDECTRSHFGHGWCELHYDRWRKTGDPHDVSIIVGDDDARFWSHVDQRGDDECWPWTGTITHEGYGVFQLGRVQVKAHRRAYHALAGPLDDDLVIDHLCHTLSADCHLADHCPHRRCCNPAHMEPVGSGENVRRGNVRRIRVRARG